MSNARKLAVKTLLKIERDNAYSNITLNSVLKEEELENEDKSFFSALVYGVLDRKITLDYVLSGFMKTSIKKTAPFTLNCLRAGLYQIMYMDKIPTSAAVNEAVKIIKSSKESRNSGFVNAVLRKAATTEIKLPEGNTAEALSIRYSAPLWICDSFIADYGSENAESLLLESLKSPPVILRVNTTKITVEDLILRLNESGIKAEQGEAEDSVIIEKGMDISANPLYKEGLFYAQDYASQKAVSVLNPKPNSRVLDLCAAPGGKSFTIACLMENKGEIISCDLYEKRVGLIASSAKRLGLDIIKPTVNDAVVFNPKLGEFDFVLCDVPCSGLGVIRRKPELKYKTDCDFKELSDIQYKILCNAVKYLKNGGKLLYSTCTLRSVENEKLVIRFEKEYNELSKVYEHTFMPHTDNTDGFYCALFEK